MRASGAALFFVGLIALIICTMNGCGTFFSWNGRHEIVRQPLVADGHTHVAFTTFPGRRYTISVQAIFDPAQVDEKNGMATVEAKMPLVVRAKDHDGTKLTELSGWLDPNEPPNVFYSRPLHQPTPGGPREISVERLIGPFLADSTAPVDVDVDLGADRIDRFPIVERRLVVHDDAWPASIRNAVIGAGAGALASAVGFVLLIGGWWQRRRPRKRSGIPRADVV